MSRTPVSRLTLFSLVAAVTLAACDRFYAAAGQVVTADHTPVADAVVTLELGGHSKSTMTASDGSFKVSFIDGGRNPLTPAPWLRVVKVGYREWAGRVSADYSWNEKLEIKLEVDPGSSDTPSQ